MTQTPQALYGSPEFSQSPYSVYNQLRSYGTPVYLESKQAWLVSRYDDVSVVLKGSGISKRFVREQLSPLERSMLFQDPPDHTRLRSLVSQAFTPKRIKDIELRIARIADDLLNRVQQKREMDFVADFALPLPVAVIAELLGVPEEDRAALHNWSVDLIKCSDSDCIPEEAGQLLMSSVGGMTQYFSDLTAARKNSPKDDILGDMIAAQDSTGILDGDELIGACILLLIAGHETTVNLLANGLLTLLLCPDQLEKLKSHPELMNSAIEEMLRYESPVQQGTYRITSSAVEMGGQVIGPGEQIIALIGAANRDPDQFELPDAFLIDRNPNRHLGFGLGIHFCLGASLARTEARIGFGRVLERFPHLSLTRPSSQVRSNVILDRLLALVGKKPAPLAPPGPIVWRNNAVVRSMNSLPVHW